MKMDNTQQQAFDIYYESADIDNSFTPISFSQLAVELKKIGLKGSKSSIGRWAVKFGWKDKIAQKVDMTISGDDEVKNLIEVSSQNAATQKTIDDFLSNERLKSDSYTILETQMMKYSTKLKEGSYLSHNEEKFVLKVLEITSAREDKLLDRQALLSATKLTNSDDVLKALENETIDIEVDE